MHLIYTVMVMLVNKSFKLWETCFESFARGCFDESEYRVHSADGVGAKCG
jgi:hypothetical protein